jgi:cytochrome c553
MKRRWTWVLYTLLGLAVVVPLLGVLFAWSGVYSVAASRGHWFVTDMFLRFGMKNSVRRHAPDIQPPALDDPDLIRLGAGHFHSGCAYCHGAPDVAISPISLQMLPPPPDLKERVGEWTDQELFWIVKHGIKYAGMPAWPAQERDDEVWTLVAFLRHLPGLDAQGYRALAFGDLRPEPATGRAIATGEGVADLTTACGRCHGAEDRLPASALVPRLHGQPMEMLLGALDAYAKGDRYSGIMQPIAVDISRDVRRRLAAYYAGLPAPAAPVESVPQSVLAERGRNLAMNGDAAAQIPACNSCHGANAWPTFPRLAGQNAPYLATQLRNWRRAPRGRTAAHEVMEPIARRLNDHQINELVAYYSSAPAETAAAPAPADKVGEP